MNIHGKKHARANAKSMPGMDLEVLRECYEHTSKLMTEKYAKEIKKVYRNRIIEHSPEFLVLL